MKVSVQFRQSLLVIRSNGGVKYDSSMITIPETDLVVHPLCLGSNIFGSNADETQSHAVMDAYSSHAGNFIFNFYSLEGIRQNHTKAPSQ